MKNINRIWLSALALVLVFSLTCGCAVYALTADNGEYPGFISDEDILRQDAWEELNSLTYTADNILGSVGDYYTSYYLNHLNAADIYSKQLLESVDSTYEQLNSMVKELDYMISERNNPANTENPICNTAVFSDTLGWGEPIYVYAWNGYGNVMTKWPGDRVTHTYTDSNGQKQYFAYIPKEYTYVIFSNGSQTVDIPFTTSGGFYPTGETDSKGCYEVEGFELPAPVYREYPDVVDPTLPPVIPTEPQKTPFMRLWESGAELTTADIRAAVNDLLKPHDRVSDDKITVYNSHRFECTPAYVVDYSIEGYGNYLAVIQEEVFGDYLFYSTSSYEPELFIDGKLYTFTKAYKEGLLTQDMLKELVEKQYKPGSIHNRCNLIARYIKGDADGDEDVNAVDATLIMRYEIGIVNDADIYKPLADVDESGSPDIIDATLVQRYSINMPTPYQIG